MKIIGLHEIGNMTPIFNSVCTDEGDMGLDSTVLVDDNITDCDVTDEDQEMIERVRSSFYFPH